MLGVAIASSRLRVVQCQRLQPNDACPAPGAPQKVLKRRLVLLLKRLTYTSQKMSHCRAAVCAEWNLSLTLTDSVTVGTDQEGSGRQSTLKFAICKAGVPVLRAQRNDLH